MCGIAGYVNIKGNSERDSSEIMKMILMQSHRGPDDQGVVALNGEKWMGCELQKGEFADENTFGMIGFCRLSIQDLSINGHQPMCSDDFKVILSFNGEIYNTVENREILIKQGIKFKSTTDTEVVLQLYLHFGIEKMMEMLNGMFAICICDLRRRMMFLIRDRMGIKPLYYAITDNRFVYCSELKSLLALKDFEPQLDEQAVREHFTFYKPLHSVLYKNVCQVQPGEVVNVNLDSFQVKCNKYFDIDDYSRPSYSCDNETIWKEKMIEVLKDCVERQKISDAKIGCQLSGGVDSSIVTYYASQYGENKLWDSISIVFDGKEKEFSEEAFVNTVQNKTNIICHKETICEDYVLSNYERALWQADSVIGRPNSVGLLLLTEQARQYVTVLLSGEGSDELLGGYTMFTQGKEVENLLRTNNEVMIESVRNQPEIIRSFADYAVISQQKTNERLCRELMVDYFSEDIIGERKALFNSFHGTNFDKQIKYSIATYLPELLMCQDKMSMANSIENRVPILDNKFIDFAFTIPESMLLKEVEGKLEGKYLLKAVCADVFGKDFAFRRKMGFGLPYYRYFMSKRFLEYFHDIILPGTRTRGILCADVLERWYRTLPECSWGESELFWKACSLEVWCQLFLDKRSFITM